MIERNYTIDLSSPDGGARATIEMHRDTLVNFRRTTSQPEELEWEIRLYDYMLEDPAKRLEQYYSVRFKGDDGIPREKRLCAAELGWNTP